MRKVDINPSILQMENYEALNVAIQYLLALTVSKISTHICSFLILTAPFQMMYLRYG